MSETPKVFDAVLHPGGTLKQQLTPDWIIIGVPHEDHVTVYASARLAHARLQWAARYFDQLREDEIRRGDMEPNGTDFKARLFGIETASGATYAEAMANLSHLWRPDDSGSTEDRQRRASLAEMNQVEGDVVYDAEIVDEGE